MALSNFLRWFRRSRCVKVRRQNRRSTGPVRLERLEARTLLAAVSWDGGAGTENWTDALNWSNDAVPTSADDVTIVAATVSLSTSEILNTLTLEESAINVFASVSLSADWLTIDFSSSINAGAHDLTLSPATAGRAINVGGADSGTELGLTDDELDAITAGTLTIGSATSGLLTVSSAISHENHLTLLSSSGITINDSVTMGADKDFSATSTSTSAGIDFATESADVATTGSGTIAITAARNVVLANSASLSTVNGTLTVSANQQALATAGNFAGIVLTGATVSTTGEGNIVMAGRGGDDASSLEHAGIRLIGSIVQTISDVPGTGTITLTGRTGIADGANESVNAGIVVDDSSVLSGAGDVTVTGTGEGASDGYQYGVGVLGAGIIASTGTGNVTVTGSAGFSGTGHTNAGVFVNGSNAFISVASGHVRVIGTGSGGAGSDNMGIRVANGAEIYSDGTVSLEGTATGALAGSNLGVLLHENGDVYGGLEVDVTGVAGTALTSRAISLADSSSTITSGPNGTISLQADSMSWAYDGGASISAPDGTVRIRPLTTGLEIDLGGPPSTLALVLDDDALEESVEAALLVIGDGSESDIRLKDDVSWVASIELWAGDGRDIDLDVFSLTATGSVTLTTSGTGAILAGDTIGPDIIGADLHLAAGSGGIGSESFPLIIETEDQGVLTAGSVDSPIHLRNVTPGFTIVEYLEAGTSSVVLWGGSFETDGASVTGVIGDHTQLVLHEFTDFAFMSDEVLRQLTVVQGSLAGNGIVVSREDVILQEGYVGVHLSGDAGVVKTGYGTVTVDSAASYLGITDIQNGYYFIEHAEALGSAVAETIVRGWSELYVVGDLEIHEPLNLMGTLAIGAFGGGTSSEVIWAGDVAFNPCPLATHATIEANEDVDVLTFTGAVSGPVEVHVTGPGRVVFDGTHSWTGDTEIQGGVVEIRRSFSADVFVSSEATLNVFPAGSPIIASGRIENDGVLDIGVPLTGPFASVQPEGDFVQGPDGVTEFVVAGPAPGIDYDQLRVFGEVFLSGMASIQQTAGFDVISGDRILLIDNDGSEPIHGTFENIAEGDELYLGPAGPWVATYVGGDGNDFELLATTVTVTTGIDSGPGSLRQAILDVNRLSTAGGTIHFQIPADPGGGPDGLITIIDALPDVTNNGLRIDGSSQSGTSTGLPQIEIRGPAGLPGAQPDVPGLRLTGFDQRLSDVAVTRFTGAGIVVNGAYIRLERVYSGVSPFGLDDSGNLGHGIHVVNSGDGIVLGVNDASVNGLIASNNGGDGILIENAGSTEILSALAGLAADGSSRAGNTGAGIRILSGPFGQHTFIDSSTIGWNAGDGLHAAAGSGSLSVVDTNVGLARGGRQSAGNRRAGIRVERDDSTAAGTAIQIADSAISDNREGGILLKDQRTTSSSILYELTNNLVGLWRDRLSGAGNGVFGIKVEGGRSAADSTSTGLISNNIVSGHADGPGVWLQDAGSWELVSLILGTDVSASMALPNDIGLLLENAAGVVLNSGPGLAGFSDSDGVSILASGNTTAGIVISASESSMQGLTLLDELIVGLDRTRERTLPNGDGVVLRFQSAGPSSGTASDALPGLIAQRMELAGDISGNLGFGVRVEGDAPAAVVTINAAIGTTSSDVSDPPLVGNRRGGVLVQSDTVVVVIDADAAIVGNRGPGLRHEGFFDGGNLVVAADPAVPARIPLIHSNTGLAIDLGTPGATDNSSLPPGGSVGITAAPVLTSATLGAGFLDVTGTNDPNAGSFLRFFATRPTVSGRGQGQTPLSTFAQLAGAPLSGVVQNYLSGFDSPLFDLDLAPDRFRFRIPVSPDFAPRLLTAAFVSPTASGLTSLTSPLFDANTESVVAGSQLAGVSEFSAFIPIGTQLTSLPPDVDAGGDQQIFAGQTLTRTVSFRDEDSVEFEVVVDYGDGGGFEFARFRPQDRTISLEHTYRETGAFVVSVSVLDDSTPIGLIDIDTFIVTVVNTPPEIRFNDVALTKRVREGETVDLQGLFDDAGLTDLHAVEVNWGDGTPVVSQTLAAGRRSFALQHTYLDDGVSLADAHIYRVVVTVRDEHGGVSATPVFLIEVDNVLPSGLSVSTPVLPVAEGEAFELSGLFDDPGLLDSHHVIIDWGDGSPRQRVGSSDIEQTGSQRSFRVMHAYPDNPEGGSQFNITVDVADDDDPQSPVSLTRSVTVTNAAPVVHSFEAGFLIPDENQSVPFSIVLEDAGREIHRAVIDWGDGTPAETFIAPPGAISLSPSHVYLRDGQYTATVTVTDRDGEAGNSESLIIDVRNHAPGFDTTSVSPGTVIQEGGEVILTGSFIDESLLDVYSLSVNWGDGTTTPASVSRTTKTWTARHRYADDDDLLDSGARTYEVTVTLNDGMDEVAQTTSITVQNTSPVADVIPVVDVSTVNPVLRARASDGSPVDQSLLSYVWTATQGGVDVSVIVRAPDEIEIVLPAAPPGGSGGPVTVADPIHVTLSVSDDDGAVSTLWTAAIIAGTDSADLLRVTNAAFTGGVERVLVFAGGGEDVIDASAVTVSTARLVLFGGAGDDVVFDGAGDSLIVLGAGNDVLNPPLDSPLNSFVDEFGDPFRITPNMAGDDEIIAVVNSVLQIWDNDGDNTLNFSQNESAVSQASGITFDLSQTVQTAPGQTLALQDVAPSSSEPATHFVGALGRFTTVVGSHYGDTLTGTSGASVFGGRGADSLKVTAGTTNANFSGGADDDVLTATGAGLAGLSFLGDDGADELRNLGTINGLTFGGGADDDVLLNDGAITATLSFLGDDGVDALMNTGTIASLNFGGGADDDVLQNSSAAGISSLSFLGDDGADALNNSGVIESLTFSGGADDDVLVNAGVVSTTLSFVGDDGLDALTNTGTIAGLTFGGGADDDLFVNGTGGSVSSLTFTGGADDDVLSNAGTIVVSLNFQGDDGDDQLTNAGSIAGLTFGGGADDDVLQNEISATISSLTFAGGADDDVFINHGVVSISLTFNGDDGADDLFNSGSVASLTFSGGADDDVLRHESGGSIGSLNFNGDDGADVLTSAGSIEDLSFGGGADDDVLENSGTVSGMLSFTGDDGADGLANSGFIASLTFTGGADDDVLENSFEAQIASLSFTGGADDDILINRGVVSDVLSFLGDDGADLLTNTGGIASLSFTGGADDDVLNNTTGTLTVLSFAGDDGSDLLWSSGAVVELLFRGGADDDVLAAAGGIGSLSFEGDDGADLLVASGVIASLTFHGGADDDVLQSRTGTVSTLVFNGDDGADVLVNRLTGLTSLTFSGGADDDILINRGHGFSDLSFNGDAGNDVFVNAGDTSKSLPGVLSFSDSSGSNAMRNEGSGWLDLQYNGGSGDDFLQNNGGQLGTIHFDGGTGSNTLENNASGVDAIVVTGNSGEDTVANDGYVRQRLVFTGHGGADLLINTGISVSGVNFDGGGDADRFVNRGESLQSSEFRGGDGDDVLINHGRFSFFVTFHGDAGADVWLNTAAASNSGYLQLQSGLEDEESGDPAVSESDVFVNFAANVFEVTVAGGLGDDRVENSGAGFRALEFSGGSGADVVRNRGTRAADLNFNGDDGHDLFEHFGTLAGSLNMAGGAGDDVLFLSGGSASSASLTGHAGRDSLINYSHGPVALLLDGGDGDDLLQNSGHGASSVSLRGGGGRNTLQNFGSLIGGLHVSDTSSPAGAEQVLLNSGSDLGEIVMQTSVAGTLFSTGSRIGLINFLGSAAADVVQVSGSDIQSLVVSAGDGDDSLLVDVQSVVGAAVQFDAGSGHDVIRLRGLFDSVVVEAGSGNDELLLSGQVESAVFAGGSGDDRYRFVDAVSGGLTIDEDLIGTNATDLSRDVLDFSVLSGGPVSLDLAQTAPQNVTPVPDPLTITLTDALGIENVIGTTGADTLFGNARPNQLSGAGFLRAGEAGGTPVALSRTRWVVLDFDSRTAAGELIYDADARAEIRDRMAASYAGLDVRLVLSVSELPAAVAADPAAFVVVYFNDTPATGRPGGEASEINFGNVEFTGGAGAASVQISGMLGGRETLEPDVRQAAEQLLDGDQIHAPDLPKPESTRENMVALSAKLGAHELGHLFGLRHYDAFGPVGFGAHSIPGGQSFKPALAGAAGAFETIDHLISSPASVGTSRTNDLRTLHFGEREAIKLALAFSELAQVRQSEPMAGHDSLATAAPLILAGLNVPNHATSGLSAGKSFSADAVSVVGFIGLAGPVSGNDWYRFEGRGGDMVTVEVMSRALRRYSGSNATSIDSVVRLYDASGQLVQIFGQDAVNDDEFETTDSLLMDVRLPADGPYFIEVDTFRRLPGDASYDAAVALRQELEARRDDANPDNDLSPDEEQFLERLVDSLEDTDTGHYELLVYRSARFNASDAIDTLKGREGVDQLTGGPDDDYVVSVSASGLAESSEAAAWTGSVSFEDRGGHSWRMDVDYGDGTLWSSSTVTPGVSIPLSHVYADNGSFIVTVTVTSDDGLTATETLNVTVGNLDPLVELTGPASLQSGVSGTYQLSAVDPAGAADPLTVTWTITRNGAAFDTQSGGAVYVLNPVTSGNYRVSVTVDDGDGGVVTRFMDVLVGGNITSFDVGAGRTQRSWIDYVDTVFASDALASDLLLNPGRVKLTRFGLNGPDPDGSGGTLINFGGASGLSRSGSRLRLNFGSKVIAGGKTKTNADGYYRLTFDLDGDGVVDETRHFYRLLGDATGDRQVTDDDVRFIEQGIKTKTYHVDMDITGDNRVNNTDRYWAQATRGRQVNPGLPLDD